MPANYPELWLNRVETRLSTNDSAPWLNGIPEIASRINEVNPGSGDGEQNEIHIPTSDFDVDILINNTTYPIEVQEYDDETVTIKLDKYQTKRVPLSDDQTIGSSYTQIDAVTNNMLLRITESKYAKAIHSLAPASDKAETPVIETTGSTGKFDSNDQEIIDRDGDRLRLTYNDLVAFKDKLDTAEESVRWPQGGRRLVLCTKHWNDLLRDRKNFGDQLVNYKTGDVAPMIAGFEIYSHFKMPYYDGGNKKAYGSTPDADDLEASVAFVVQNVGKKTGMTKQYFTPAAIDTATQANTLAYRHYFIVVPKQAKYTAAIVSGTI